MVMARRGRGLICALPNSYDIGTPGSPVRPRCPRLREASVRDLESTGQGTHLSRLRTTERPRPRGHPPGRGREPWSVVGPWRSSGGAGPGVEAEAGPKPGGALEAVGRPRTSGSAP